MPAIIDVTGLTKSYGRKRGIVDLSFQVTEGTVFGFLGPNGAGKTTTIRLLMALLFPDRGSARVAGLDCWRASVAVKRVVGYLPSEISLDPNLTGAEILTYLGHLRGGVDTAYVARLIARLDLDTSRRFRQYSHGNKQKVGLIQAFMHRPRLLILDEPTNGLDPLHQQEFARMVAEVRADGRTVLLSSHILADVEAMCDDVAIVRDGRLARVGSVDEITDIKRHEVEITFAGTPPAEAFRGLAGVERLVALTDGHTLKLTLHGGMDAVVKTAARHALVNFVSREPSLEEIFLQYYQGDGAAATGEAGRVVP